MLSQGSYRAEKIQYSDGVGCCVWRPFWPPRPGDENIGICFDFPADDLDDMIALLTALRNAPVEMPEKEL